MRTFSRLILVVLSAALAGAAEPEPKLVTPDPLPEATALLRTLYALSGQHTLSGQHNYPAIKDRNTQFAAKYIGKMPAVFSSDLGHARAGDTDSYLARPDIVQESIRQHRLGALVTLCWHAVPPTADEPVTFRQLPDSDPKQLKSVQGKLLDEQFKDLLTPGTPLYQHWCEQVDAIAVFLKQLEEARVPVLWRPYHEMNGDWFWWGGRTGQYSTAALYRKIFDRLVHHHKLKNLIWVWSMDRMPRAGMEHDKYFPGIDYVDVLGLDVYGNDFSPRYYESLVKLSQGKPLALAEVGNIPSREILMQQPRWTFYVVWAGMVRNSKRSQYLDLMRDGRVLNLDDAAYAQVMSSYRAAAKLGPIELRPRPADFAGTWVLNEERSETARGEAAHTAARLEITRAEQVLSIRSTRILEFTDDEVTEERLSLDGKPTESDFMQGKRVTTARLSADGDQLALASTLQLPWGPKGMTVSVTETWQLEDGGRQLVVQREIKSPAGQQQQKLVYDRR